MPRRYVPNRGEVVWLSLKPPSARGSASRRPAVVLSPESYNRKAGLALFCPVTRQVKGYPFETPLPPKRPLRGVALCDQIQSVDWAASNAEFIFKLPEETLHEVMGKALALLKQP